jgi:hypothetical protein
MEIQPQRMAELCYHSLGKQHKEFRNGLTKINVQKLQR